MAQVLVRNLDPETVERLKARAKRHNRSLQAELREILARAASESAVPLEERFRRLDELFAGHSFSDSTEIIREERDRR